MYKVLLACSTQLHNLVKRFDRNLSSMTTEITILADENADQGVAEESNIKISNTLLQTHAVVDSGSDINCSAQTPLGRVMSYQQTS